MFPSGRMIWRICVCSVEGGNRGKAEAWEGGGGSFLIWMRGCQLILDRFDRAKTECKRSISFCMFFLYRNPSVSYEWFDDFVQMIDNLRAAKSHADILLLGDFNIDLLKPHSSWDSTITLLGLTQLIESPTRITPTSATLIDHIYTNNPDAFTDVSVSDH